MSAEKHEEMHIEYPDKFQPLFKKAKKLEWITVAYVVSVVVFMFLVMEIGRAHV